MPLRSITLTETCPFQAIYKQGKLCIDTPSVLELFLQLTSPGPTGNAVFTKRFSFSLSLSCCCYVFCIYARSMSTTSDVTQTIWPRTLMRLPHPQALRGHFGQVRKMPVTGESACRVMFSRWRMLYIEIFILTLLLWLNIQYTYQHWSNRSK
jgi:hypothetical protein